MKYEELSEGIRTVIHDEWNDFSHKLAMNSEDGRFSMMDIRKAFYAGIDSVLKQLGWHPASELPPVNKDTGYSDVVCFYANARDGKKLFLFEGRYCKAYIGEKKAHNPFINDGWCYADGGKINEVLNVKWWCYPPKEE